MFSVFHISRATVNEFMDELDRWCPDYWGGYPSAMSLLCKHAARMGRACESRPKAIFAGSEKVYPDDREAMRRVAGCSVMSGYGSREYVCRILECERGTFHADPEYGIVEIVGDDGEPARSGRLIATGFANRVMPLIRYDTGDLASWAEGECECGRESLTVSEIMGRIEDCIVTADGRTIGRISGACLGSANVIESQIYQPDPQTIVMRIVRDRKYGAKDELTILRGLRAKLGSSLAIRFEYTDALPRTPGGKLRAVVSDVRGDLG
jgi:phenylacetate-CoA ligase